MNKKVASNFVLVAIWLNFPQNIFTDDVVLMKVAREAQLREECIAAMDSAMGDNDGGCVIINLFALEGWHLAELYRVPCAVLAPYLIPYSAPSAFERRFRAVHPLLYRSVICFSLRDSLAFLLLFHGLKSNPSSFNAHFIVIYMSYHMCYQGII